MEYEGDERKYKKLVMDFKEMLQKAAMNPWDIIVSN